MPAERFIGVDFGTSTSLIRVKRYQDGKPIGDRLGTDKVTFNMGSTMVPTLIEKLSTGGAYFGFEAQSGHRNAKTFRDFKVDIENPDEGIRRQARELTAEFFTYLAKTYKEQSEGGHLGEIDDRQRTIVSYPVKWSAEAKDFLVQTAKDAGFPHVEGIDEAQAAIQAVTVQNADLLTRKGYFRNGIPVNILLIDMGAGTTDLVLCRHTPGQVPKTDILKTWPQRGDALFGGREVDKLLRSYISQAMPEGDADTVLRKIGLEKYKAWKESIVSPALKKRETVDSFAALDEFLDIMDVKVKYSIDRDSFETHAAVYLHQFPEELVKGCVKAAGISGDNVDLVILTGGHSQWYFVREMLSGKLNRFGKIGLGKIQSDANRIISVSLPHETVALGLVYGPMKVEPPTPEPKPKPKPESKPKPKTKPLSLKYDPHSLVRTVIAAGEQHTVGLKKDGTVVAVGANHNGQCNVSDLQDIVAVAAGCHHTLGLTKDGRVVVIGKLGKHRYQLQVDDWRNIVAIAAGLLHTVGLKKDGTVVVVGETPDIERKMSGWRDIVAIAAGSSYTVGLKKDGTVVAVGANSDGQCKVSAWRDIVAITAGWNHTVGLKKDGTVVAVGGNGCGKCEVDSWRDIVAVAAGLAHTVGLKKDGTVVAVGSDVDGQCKVSGWRDIVAVAAGRDHTVGLKKDGSVIAFGSNENGQTSFFNYNLTIGKFLLKQALLPLSRSGVRAETTWNLFE